MNNPIHVEKLYRKLIRELESHQSIRHRYTLIRHFTHQLEGDYDRYESYLIQLAEKLPVYSSFVTYSGLDPAILENDIEAFRELSDKFEDIRNSENFRKAVERLKVVCLIQYICVGEVEKLSQLLFNWHKIEVNLNGKIEFRTDSEYLFKISKLLKRHVTDVNEKEKRVFKLLLDELEQLLKSDPDSAFVPTVEVHQHKDLGRLEYGRLRKLHIQVDRVSNEGYDKIYRRYPVIGIEQAEWPESRKISEAARSLILNNKKVSDGKYYNGHAQYQTNIAFHDGESANAAIALLWFVGLQRKSNQRERYELQPDLCITGNVDSTGNLLPVDSEGVDAKTRASFFSMVNYMVVQESQHFQFIEAIDELKREYPNRDLRVIGIKELKELFYDRRLTIHINHSKINHYAKIAWKKKFQATGIAIILIMAMTIFRLAYGPLDKNPVLYSFTGEVLQIKNQSEVKLETIPVGTYTVHRANTRPNSNFVVFQDITGTGKEDIIWADIEEDENFRISYLNSKKLRDGELIWQKPLQYDLNFSEKPFVVERDYYPAKLSMLEGQSNNPKLIISADHIQYFPGLLSIRDIITGEELSHFINTGRIQDYQITDLNNDGSQEIIFCGINNAFNMAFMAIMSVDDVYGHSPLTDEYRIEGYEINKDIKYVLIPKTIIGQSVTTHTSYNVANRITLQRDDSVIQVNVIDFQQYTGSNVELPASKAFLLYNFDFDLNLIGVGTSDGYDLTSNFLYTNGMIKEYPDNRYFDNFREKLLYWDGDDFVSFEEFSAIN